MLTAMAAIFSCMASEPVHSCSMTKHISMPRIGSEEAPQDAGSTPGHTGRSVHMEIALKMSAGTQVLPVSIPVTIVVMMRSAHRAVVSRELEAGVSSPAAAKLASYSSPPTFLEKGKPACLHA